MSVFETSRHLCSWAGLTPQNDQCAGKKKTHPHFPRRGVHQAAACAVRFGCHQKQQAPRSQKPLQRYQKTARTQVSDYRHRQNAVDRYLQHPKEKRALQRSALPPVR